jgi:eukaryotic-like serine/threonine-protein kinase
MAPARDDRPRAFVHRSNAGVAGTFLTIPSSDSLASLTAMKVATSTGLQAADLGALGRLLDHALDLAPDALEPWLADLPATTRHLAPRLRSLLSGRAAGACAGFMAGRPRLDDAANDALMMAPGDRAGRYRLLSPIGRGGMCSVWLAEHVDLGAARQFAVKLPHAARTADLARRMAQEREVSALMDHPNVGRLLDHGNDAHGRPYLVLDYIRGLPLDEWCASQRLGIAGRLRLFVQVARAVTYIHGRGVVHRDLKPANVLVSDEGQAHVLDFGIACRPASAVRAAGSERSLTPAYASPEQRRGAAAACSSDVYSLGVMLFELLTGELPWRRERGLFSTRDDFGPGSEAPLASATAKNEALAESLRGAIDATLAKALAARPEHRHLGVSALAEDIERHLARLESRQRAAAPRSF